MKKLLFILSCVMALTGCSTLRNTGDAYRPNEPLSVTAKLSAKFDSDDSGKSFGGTLRMRRDRVIQLSITKFGIEGARILFTPDSVIVLDRLHKRYIAGTYAGITSLTPDAPILSFEKVQSFLWNEKNRSREELTATLGGLFAVELNVERRHTKRIRDFKIPQETHIDANLFEKEIDLDLNLSKIKINYNWNANTEVPSNYTPFDPKLLQGLFKQIFQ